MGAVYEALDKRLNVTVALKQSFSVDQHLRRQFESEARLLASLSHRALPKVSDYFVEGELAYLVMEFIEGEDLAMVLASERGPLSKDRVVAWADQLLDALIYLHTRERQIIHRDIKPHNLKLTSSGTIALLDFGLARLESQSVSGTAPVFGYTRRYSPLEQIQDGECGPRSDLYALGATLYHLLTGVKPPDAETRDRELRSHSLDTLRPANELCGSIDLGLAAVLSKALALRSEDRFETAAEFREALAKVGRERSESESTVVVESADSSSGWRMLAPVALSLVLLGAAFLLWSRSSGKVSEVVLDVAGELRGEAVETVSKARSRRMNLQPAVSSAPSIRQTRSQRVVRHVVGAARPAPKGGVRLPETRVARRLAAARPKVVALSLKSRPAPEGARSRDEVLRAPDGTEVIKFANGSVRTFRYGERRQ